MCNVLITSGDSRVAYVMSKAISKLGYSVYIGDISKNSMATVSRHATASMVYTSHRKNKELFISDLEKYISEQNIQILMPSLDEAYVLAEYIDRLKESVKIVLPSIEKIRLVHDKYLATNLCTELGIAVPKTWEASELIKSHELLESLPYPVIIKPKRGKGGWATEKCVDIEALKKLLNETENTDEFIVQQFIEGKVVATCAIYNQGKCVAIDSYIATAVYPLDVGQPTKRKTEHFEGALNSLKKLLDHLEWNGFCEVDFIIDKKAGTSYLLDINPRCWSSVAQNIISGINYPLYYCEIALGRDDITVPSPKNVKTCFMSANIQRIVAEFVKSKSKICYIKKCFSSSEHIDAYDDWDIKDPLPFILWWIKAFQKKIFKKY